MADETLLKDLMQLDLSDYTTTPYNITTNPDTDKQVLLSDYIRGTTISDEWKTPAQDTLTNDKPGFLGKTLWSFGTTVVDTVRNTSAGIGIAGVSNPISTVAGVIGASKGATAGTALVGKALTKTAGLPKYISAPLNFTGKLGGAVVGGAAGVATAGAALLTAKEAFDIEPAGETGETSPAKMVNEAQELYAKNKITEEQYNKRIEEAYAIQQGQDRLFKNETVDLLKGRDYPDADVAGSVLSWASDLIQDRRLLRSVQMEQRGQNPNDFSYQAGSVFGSLTPIIAANYLYRSALLRPRYETLHPGSRFRETVVEKANPFTRQQISDKLQNFGKAFVGTQELANYTAETVSDYIERTGDKDLVYYQPSDIQGLMAGGYAAISAITEYELGGLEDIITGSFKKVGIKTPLAYAYGKAALQEGGEEFVQQLEEFLARKIDGTTDKTWGEVLKEALVAGVWGAAIGGFVGGTAFKINRTNLVKGIMKFGEEKGIKIDEQNATKIADTMMETVEGSLDPKKKDLWNNLRGKISFMMETSDIANKEDRIDSITDLEYALIAADAGFDGIDIENHPLFQGEVNKLGWFRAGIPEESRAVVNDLLNELNDLETQLKTLNEAQDKDWEKIDEIERKLEMFDRYVLDKLGENAPASLKELDNELRKVENKYVAKEKKKKGIKVPTDTPLFQDVYVSMKGEIEGDYLDFDTHLGRGDNTSVWFGGNYTLTDLIKDKANYYDRFIIKGPDLLYDGVLVDSADFFNKLGIYDSDTREKLAHSTDILDTQERVVADLKRALKLKKNDYDKLVQRVVDAYKNALGEARVREIISDIEKIVKGKGVAVGAAANFDPELHPDEYKIQQKYRDKNGKLDDDFIDIYTDLVNEFSRGGMAMGNPFIDAVIEITRAEKSLDIVEKLDWDKFHGRTGMTYKGKSAEMVLDQIINRVTNGFQSAGMGYFSDAGAIEEEILDTVKYALSHNEDIKTSLKELEPKYKRIVDVLPTLKRELKYNIDRLKKAKYPEADAKLVEKKLFEFASGINSVDYFAFSDFLNKNELSGQDYLLADAVVFNAYNETLYPDDIVDKEEKFKELLDIIYAVRSANTKLKVLKEAEKDFTSKKDFVYKPKATLYRAVAPENDVLMIAQKPLNKQPKKVQKSLLNFINDYRKKMPFLNHYVTNNTAMNELLEFFGIDDGQGTFDISLMKDMQNNMMQSPYFSSNYNAIERHIESFLNHSIQLAVQRKGTKATVADIISALDDEIQLLKPSDQAPNSFHEEYQDCITMVDVLKKKLLGKHSKDTVVADVIDVVTTELKSSVTAKKFYDDIVNNLVIKPDLIKELKQDKSLDIKEKNNPPQIIVSKLLRKYGIMGGRYYGRHDGHGIVTFDKTPVVERIYQSTPEKNLVATHAIKKTGMEQALKVGGFAMPSLAIQKDLKNNYGDIVFVAPASLAQPSRTTKVYDRDAWTPMINFIEYNSNDWLHEHVKDVLKQHGLNPNSASSYIYNIEEGMKEGFDAKWNSMALQLFAIEKDIRIKPEPLMDIDEIRRMVIENDPKLKDEYYKWYDEVIVGNTKPRIFRGFTELGNRRYAPVTLDNLVRELKTQSEHRENNTDLYFFYDVVREIVTRFKNIKELKKQSDRILSDPEEIRNKVHELNVDYNALASELNTDESNHIPEMSLAMALIEGTGSTAERLERVGLKHDPESVKKVDALVERIKKIPVKYFEGKVRRGVRFDEFSAAFVPNKESYNSIAEQLTEQGVQVLRYDTVEDMNKQFNNLVLTNDNIKFQNRPSGAAPSTYRGAYIPQYRFIQRTNKMDASTLSHELAHDWFEINFNKFRSSKASPEFMRAWGALEKALGITDKSTKAEKNKASEAFARAYEGWIMNNKGWEKLINVDDKDRDDVIKLMLDYQSDLRDIYQDLTNPYFKQTWGKLGEMKPEIKAWFDKVVNITDIDKLVERGEMTPEQASQEKLNRAIDTVIENTENAETKKTLKTMRVLNDTQRYEAEGGNKNALQVRLANLAQAIDENNMLIKENYDTHRDMLEVAKQADNFVKTRLEDALAIINGQMAEQEGLFKEDIYTALERLALENGDLNLLDELKNSEVANRLAKELGQRVAGFRNWNAGDIDIVSSLKALDNKFNKALQNKKAQAQMAEAEQMFAKAQDQQDKMADKQLDSFLKDIECK